jgi:aspartate/methionine/tyrosine aminotransferase
VAGGPAPQRDAALAGLELIADSFLSVSTPVQLALPHLLNAGAKVRETIQQRTRTNLRTLHEVARECPACDVRRVEGGWSAVIRVPATRSEDDLVVSLLEQEAVLVHPGYFFDFRSEAFVIVSLLPPETVFGDAVRRTLRFATR